MIDRIVKDHRTHSFENLEDIVLKLNYFREVSRGGLHNLSKPELDELKKHFDDFLNLHVAFIGDTYPTRLFRITNNKKLTGGKKLKLQKISDLIGPPAGISNLGRCNLNGESVFYAALDFQTAVWETQPQVGDYITLSEWKIKSGHRLYNHFVFHPEETNLSKESQDAYEAHLKAQSTINPSLAPIFMELMKFFAEEFMKPVGINTESNYLFTGIISSRFLQDVPDGNGFKIESISYPSTKRDNAVTNIAILNSLVLEKLDLVDVTIFDVCETNYDTTNKNRDDLIKVSALQTHVKEFDLANDKIHYDLARELKDAMALIKKRSE